MPKLMILCSMYWYEYTLYFCWLSSDHIDWRGIRNSLHFSVFKQHILLYSQMLLRDYPLSIKSHLESLSILHLSLFKSFKLYLYNMMSSDDYISCTTHNSSYNFTTRHNLTLSPIILSKCDINLDSKPS